MGILPAMQGRHMALFMSVNVFLRFGCTVTSVLCVNQVVSQWVVNKSHIGTGMRYGDAFLQLTSWFASFLCFSLDPSHGELLFTLWDTKRKSFMEFVYWHFIPKPNVQLR